MSDLKEGLMEKGEVKINNKVAAKARRARCKDLLCSRAISKWRRGQGLGEAISGFIFQIKYLEFFVSG